MRRRAFTLVEMLVVVAIVGLLAALLLPAIQRARAEAKKRECQSNLKQIGHALTMYADQFGDYYPRGRLPGGYGPLAGLLPFVGNVPLYNAINFDYPYYHAVNETVVRTQMELFTCPADNISPLPGIPNYSNLPTWGRGSYVGNTGSGIRPDVNLNRQDVVADPTNIFYPTDGLFYAGDYTRATARLHGITNPANAPIFQQHVLRSAVRDGLEYTVAYSETTAGPSSPTYGPGILPDSGYNTIRFLFGYNGGTGADGIAGTFDDGPYNCNQGTVEWYYGLKQSTWIAGHYGDGLYNHAKTPNAAEIDCVAVVPAQINPEYGYSVYFMEPDADLFDLAPGSGTFYRYARGYYTARSLHGGGVNVLLAGGRVTFVNDTVDLTTWRAHSTRASGEVQQSF